MIIDHWLSPWWLIFNFLNFCRVLPQSCSRIKPTYYKKFFWKKKVPQNLLTLFFLEKIVQYKLDVRCYSSTPFPLQKYIDLCQQQDTKKIGNKKFYDRRGKEPEEQNKKLEFTLRVQFILRPCEAGTGLDSPLYLTRWNLLMTFQKLVIKKH